MTEEFELIELEVGGRALPIRAVRSGPVLYVLARAPDTPWSIVAERSGFARAQVAHGWVELGVRLVSDGAERRRVVGLFQRFAGPAAFGEWFPHPGRLLRLDPLSSSGHAPSAAEQYARWRESEFDAASEEYEKGVASNAIERWSRQVSLEILERTFRGRTRLLEVGSGPGIETIPLLEGGHILTAIDVSPRMLERLGERARRAGVAERLTSFYLAAGELDRLVPPAVPPGGFDGAYSTFGAMNLEPEPGRVIAELARCLAPGAPLVVGFFNRWALSEVIASVAGGEWARAVARFQPLARVGRTRFSVDYYPRSVPEMVRCALPWFDLVDRRGFPLILPPPDRARRFLAWLRETPSVWRIDATLGRVGPLAALADHVWLTFRKRSPGAS